MRTLVLLIFRNRVWFGLVDSGSTYISLPRLFAHEQVGSYRSKLVILEEMVGEALEETKRQLLYR